MQWKSQQLGNRERINYSTHRLRYTYKLRTACIEMKRAGTLKVSKKISAAFSRLMLGFRGASVSSTGCYQRRNVQSIAYDQKIKKINTKKRNNV